MSGRYEVQQVGGVRRILHVEQGFRDVVVAEIPSGIDAATAQWMADTLTGYGTKLLLVPAGDHSYRQVHPCLERVVKYGGDFSELPIPDGAHGVEVEAVVFR